MGALLNIQMQIVYTFSHHLNIYTVYRYLHSLHIFTDIYTVLNLFQMHYFQTLYSVQPNSEATDASAAAGLHLAPGEETRRVFFNFDIDVHRV